MASCFQADPAASDALAETRSAFAAAFDTVGHTWLVDFTRG
jgi:hypothetical protein